MPKKKLAEEKTEIPSEENISEEVAEEKASKKTQKKEEAEVEKPKKISLQEYEKKVLELADSGLTAEKIGEALKKQGIHSKDYEKKISTILGKKYVNPDLKNAENKLERIKVHYEKNKQDKRAKREKDRIFSQVRKIKRYLGQLK